MPASERWFGKAYEITLPGATGPIKCYSRQETDLTLKEHGYIWDGKGIARRRVVLHQDKDIALSLQATLPANQPADPLDVALAQANTRHELDYISNTDWLRREITCSRPV